MLKLPPPTRVAIGTVEIAGKKYEVFASIEWARYFQSLNGEVDANTAALAQSGALTALLANASETADQFPGPPGPHGAQGDPGLALFMLQDAPDEQQFITPPASSFTTLTASAGFGCNGKAAQSSATVNAAATDLATVIALCNQLRAALIANGIAV